MTAAVESCGAFTNGYTTPDNSSFTYSYKCKTYKLSATELYNQNVTTKISSTHEKSKDALYDMFCMPYGAIKVGSGAGISYNPEFDTTEEVSIAAATALAIAMGGGSGAGNKIYDLQLLPYCPVQTQIVDDGQLTTYGMAEHTNFEYIYDNSTDPATKIGILYYIPNGNFTLDVAKPINYERFAYITGFTDISIPGGWIATLNHYQDYVLTTLATPQSIIDLGPAWIDDNGYYNITALETNPSRYTNGIVFKKIHKTSGAIIEQYDCSKLEVHMCTNSASNELTVYKYYNDVQVVQETITKPAYDNADYYIAYQIVSEAYGGRGIDQCWAVISKIPIYNYQVSEATALKLDNECNMYRLISPNYQGEFEFSVAKNNGVDFFNVDCSYKPYNPYIHVNPNFKGLYGKDFNDGRGLICNGDFSFGMISDAFTNYELANKNYQAVFNRQIQNMDVMQSIERTEAVAGMATGIVKGTASGAMAGGMAGGGYGAIAGAIIGGVSSTVGGALDLVNLDKRQREEKSFAVDMYNYSLQNVHALSYSLTRCTALTYNNKLFPFVEKWTCTPEEKDALLEKLHYDGMTVNRIGKIQDYIGNDTMVRGEIIRIDLNSDNHMANEIYNEIRKGVYL